MWKGSGILAGGTCVLLLGAAFAAWPTDPAVNVPVCTAPESQIYLAATPDGTGGFVAAWQDSRGSSADIYAQRVSADGEPLWTTDGVVACDASGQQWEPAIVPDATGGAIVVWEDRRVIGADVFAQRIDANGNPLWTDDGVTVVSAGDTQEDVEAVSDGTGGVIVIWVDERPASGSDILAQRLDSSGNRLWGPDGVACCAAPGYQYDAEIVSDGAGGAIVAWQDERPAEVYLQRLLPDGSTPWTTDGVPLGSAGGYSSEHAVCSDGFGGIIVAFTDDRLGSRDIYVQRFDADGSPLWAESGIAVCTDEEQQDEAAVCPDGNGGAIVAWEDDRGSDTAIYAQRLDFRGDVMWTLDGVLICDGDEDQATVELVSDGAGGAIAVWRDWRDYIANIAEDLYAQRIDAGGALLWEATGLPVSTAVDAQRGHVVMPSDPGAALVVWEDRRDERTSDHKQDVYAQRLDGGGAAGAACTIGSAVALQGTGFGKKRPKVFVLYEKKPGKQKAAALKVTAWTDTTIDALWKKKVPLAAYPVWVRPKGAQAAPFGEVTVVAPDPDAGQDLTGAPKTRLTVTGMHFGTRGGKVYAEYVNAKGKTKRKRCKVVKKTWVMDPATGESSFDFLVPKLPAGTYDLLVVNKLGEARLEVTVN